MKIEDRIAELACKTILSLENRGGLDTRKSDEADFFEVSVWEFRDLLRAVYDMGKKDGIKLMKRKGEKKNKDTFFSQTHCDRCKKPLGSSRIMSQFNTECICMACKEEEKKDPEYQKAIEAERQEILKGNYNYKGLRG